ncbi:MAG TPA: T9SS type A sorting domain-containing protein, partial [Chitinispirillaceae bacterium]|nr:T9SS type A sorting domain-containing protein [Chitinispirillaceae bacterium]
RYSVSDGNVLTVTLPSKSVSMIRLMPVVSTQQRGGTFGNFQSGFSVKSGADRNILISSTLNKQTPMTVSIYSVNGKTLIGKVSRNIGTGSFTIGNNLGKGVYLVTISGNNENVTKQVAITR